MAKLEIDDVIVADWFRKPLFEVAHARAAKLLKNEDTDDSTVMLEAALKTAAALELEVRRKIAAVSPSYRLTMLERVKFAEDLIEAMRECDHLKYLVQHYIDTEIRDAVLWLEIDEPAAVSTAYLNLFDWTDGIDGALGKLLWVNIVRSVRLPLRFSRTVVGCLCARKAVFGRAR